MRDRGELHRLRLAAGEDAVKLICRGVAEAVEPAPKIQRAALIGGPLNHLAERAVLDLEE